MAKLRTQEKQNGLHGLEINVWAAALRNKMGLDKSRHGALGLIAFGGTYNGLKAEHVELELQARSLAKTTTNWITDHGVVRRRFETRSIMKSNQVHPNAQRPTVQLAG